MGRTADIWYLGHSGFAVGIERYLLIFDYYLDNSEGDERSLETGVIEPEKIKDRKVIIFSSHRHQDHFNPVILSWKDKLSLSEFFISSDIPKIHKKDWMHFLSAYELYKDSEIRVQTFKSTDEGVAFLVTIQGITIYHAGDLNWWHWAEEPKDWNNDMAARFKHEVSLIKDHSIDIAFLTTDPRQEKDEFRGITWFLEHVNTKTAFPMHFGNDYSIMERIRAESLTNPLLSKVQPINKRGQHFQLILRELQ